MQELDKVTKILKDQGDFDDFNAWCDLTGNDLSAAYSVKLWGEFKSWQVSK